MPFPQSQPTESPVSLGAELSGSSAFSSTACQTHLLCRYKPESKERVFGQNCFPVIHSFSVRKSLLESNQQQRAVSEHVLQFLTILCRGSLYAMALMKLIILFTVKRMLPIKFTVSTLRPEVFIRCKYQE